MTAQYPPRASSCTRCGIPLVWWRRPHPPQAGRSPAGSGWCPQPGHQPGGALEQGVPAAGGANATGRRCATKTWPGCHPPATSLSTAWASTHFPARWKWSPTGCAACGSHRKQPRLALSVILCLGRGLTCRSQQRQEGVRWISVKGRSSPSKMTIPFLFQGDIGQFHKA